MKNTYNNPWIPEKVFQILQQHEGSILDVGGGAAPYWRASHIVDYQPFDAERLQKNQWGKGDEDARGGRGSAPSRVNSVWTSSDYTQIDLCSGRSWPFANKKFDLGLCSHCLEDLRDPLPAVRELSRVCSRVLIVTPSRLLEQTKGIDHPRYCGLNHHPWMVFEENGRIIFRRKTSVVELKGCHVVCPLGKRLRVESGSALIMGENLEAEERVFWDESADYQDYEAFIRPYVGQRDLFVSDGRRHGLRFWVWRLKQKYLGYL